MKRMNLISVIGALVLLSQASIAHANDLSISDHSRELLLSADSPIKEDFTKVEDSIDSVLHEAPKAKVKAKAEQPRKTASQQGLAEGKETAQDQSYE